MARTIQYSYASKDTNCVGKVVSPENAKNSSIVLIFPTWMGINDFILKKAHEVADQGFTGFCVDMFGEGKATQDVAEAKSLIEPLYKNRLLLLERATAAFDTAKKILNGANGKIAAMGYCFGGMCTLDLFDSGANLAGAISIHAVLGENLEDLHTKPLPRASHIKGKLLMLHGYKDPLAKIDDLIKLQNALTEANIDWQTHIFGTAAHAFTNPEVHDQKTGFYFDPLANTRSTLLIKDFLKEVLL